MEAIRRVASLVFSLAVDILSGYSDSDRSILNRTVPACLLDAPHDSVGGGGGGATPFIGANVGGGGFEGVMVEGGLADGWGI